MRLRSINVLLGRAGRAGPSWLRIDAFCSPRMAEREPVFVEYVVDTVDGLHRGLCLEAAPAYSSLDWYKNRGGELGYSSAKAMPAQCSDADLPRSRSRLRSRGGEEAPVKPGSSPAIPTLPVMPDDSLYLRTHASSQPFSPPSRTPQSFLPPTTNSHPCPVSCSLLLPCIPASRSASH